ncbi:hypothetical protein PIB30_038003 [Stylosanthes scabra]|uniref:Uncharacterized protein n=1 Tax=Stylosanthes scabra TaxID=79078 RepID=A0ABU6QDF2_9FABA|nr:hypothetical protein [Stylosanthes scabra]
MDANRQIDENEKPVVPIVGGGPYSWVKGEVREQVSLFRDIESVAELGEPMLWAKGVRKGGLITLSDVSTGGLKNFFKWKNEKELSTSNVVKTEQAPLVLASNPYSSKKKRKNPYPFFFLRNPFFSLNLTDHNPPPPSRPSPFDIILPHLIPSPQKSQHSRRRRSVVAKSSVAVFKLKEVSAIVVSVPRPSQSTSHPVAVAVSVAAAPS